MSADAGESPNRRRATFDRETVDFVERYVVGPVITQFTERMDSIEAALTAGLGRFGVDLKDALSQTSATMRIMQDPETGFISRAEMGLMMRNFDDKLRAAEESSDDKIKGIYTTATAVATAISLLFGAIGFVIGKHP